MTFPGAGAQIYRNDAGEPLGWDYPGYDEGPDPDDFDPYDNDFDEDGAPDWVECHDCGDEFDSLDGPDGFQEHTRVTEHKHWS